MFTGNRLTIGASGLGIHADALGEHVLACMVQLGAAQTWTNASEAVFTVSGLIQGANPLHKNGLGKMIFSANNTFSGGLAIDQGGIQLNSSTNSMGAGAVMVGTNATLELNGAFNWRPVALTLYGQGTNGAGALRQVSSGLGQWRGDITLGADSRISIPIGTFATHGNLAAGTSTLYITNDGAFTMEAGQLTGAKTDGDGALHKSGTGGLFLRAGTLAGSLVVEQGALRLIEDLTDSDGVLTLRNGASLTSSNTADRTVAKPVAVEGAVTLGYQGVYGGALTLGDALDLSAGTPTLYISNAVTVYGAVANGGFTKMGMATMTVAGANTYVGDTTVGQGVLVVSGSSTGSAHTVASAGTLRGAGTVAALAISGAVDPANTAGTAGTLNVSAVTLNNGGVLRIDMPRATNTAGADWDLLAATGDIAVPGSGSFIIQLAGAGEGFNPGVNQAWKIMDGASVSGFDANRFSVDDEFFTPAIYEGTYGVSNDAAAGDLYLTFRPSVQDGGYFNVLPAGPTSMELEFDLNGAAQDVTIVYNQTGVFTAPTGTPVVGEALAGGTVAYVGHDSSQILTGLVSCTHYYFKMYSYYDERYSGGMTDDDWTDGPPAPVVLPAENITTNSFEARWEASEGATSYRLDVSLNPFFTGGAAGALETFLFQGFEGTAGDNWTLISGNNYVTNANPATDSPSAGRILTGSYSWQRRYGAATLQLANSSIEGYTTRTVEVRVASTSTNGTNGADALDKVTIFVALDGAAFAATPDITIAGASANNARWGYNANLVVATTAGAAVAVSAPYANSLNVTNYATARITLPNNAATLSLKIVASNNAASEVWAIDDVRIVGASIGSSFVAGYEDLLVAGTNQVVTNLEVDTTYYYRVRSVSDGDCVRANSDTEPVITTIEVPDTPLWMQASDGTSTNQVRIDWTDVLTETGYVVRRWTADDFGSSEAIGTTSMGITNLLDTTAVPGQQYYYWIVATNRNGAGIQSTADTGYRRLATVAGVAATDGDYTNMVTVTWSNVVGETGFGIWRFLQYNSNTFAECIGTVTNDVLTFDDTTAIPGWTYYYWVLATNDTSDSLGAWSLPDIGYRTPIEEPTVIMLMQEGREMVRAVILPNAANDDILVLHDISGPIMTHPGPFTNYVPGNTVGPATVIYKGSATNFREHVVLADTTNHYRIYSIQPTNPYYSEGWCRDTPIITMPYPTNLYSETFSYTNVTLNTDSFTNKHGGPLWTAPWSLTNTGSGYAWQVQTNGVPNTPAFTISQSNYPTVVGNRAVLIAGAGPGTNTARRTITARTNGTVFIGAVVAYKYQGVADYMTIGLMNGDTTELEFGKVMGRMNYFDLRRSGANAGSGYQMNGWGEASEYTNNWYWMVIKYDFGVGGGTAYAKCYHRGEGIPYLAPTNWDAEWPGIGMTNLSAIELKAGSDSGTVGGAIWDEIRVSSIWPELIGQPGLIPSPTLVEFGEVESTLSSNITLWIANKGGDNVPLYITNNPAITLTGADAPFFSISTNRFEDIFFFNQSNNLVVTFWPTNVGTVAYTDAWLMVENNSGVNPYPIQLTGTGVPTVSTNPPMVSNYFVGDSRWVTDAMVTSGAFAVTAEVYHIRGIKQATYDILNGDGDLILTNQDFDAWSTVDGLSYVLSDAVHPGAWPATPSPDYLLRVTLTASNNLVATNTLYTADGVITAGDLFFSEYVSGTNFNKALEVFNGTGVPVELSEYGILFKMNNENLWNSDYEPFPTQTLAPGATFVVVHPSAVTDLLARANYTNADICIFNGNDSIFLFKGPTEETPVDSIGASPSGGYFAENTTLRRLSAVHSPQPVYNSLEWTNLAAITYDNLGEHEMDGACGLPMHFTVDDDDAEGPELANILVNGTAPSEFYPGPDIAYADIPAGGLAIAWDIQDFDSGLFAASNRFILRTGDTAIASGYLPAGAYANGDGLTTALSFSTNVPKSALVPGVCSLNLIGHDYDPEWDGDILAVSNQVFFRVLAPLIGVTPVSLDFGEVVKDAISNLTVTVTNSGNDELNVTNIAFTGTGYASFLADYNSLTVQPGEAADITVSFEPSGGGTFAWTMTLYNDSANNPTATVSLAGSCDDPETMPPEVVAYTIQDERLIDNEVTDHAAANGQITATFVIYQVMGMRSAGASFDLIYPDGTLAVENVPLTITGSITNNNNVQYVFRGYPPAFYPATLGVYTARVTAVSSNGIEMTEEVNYTTRGLEQTYALNDDFNRTNGTTLGNGWSQLGNGSTLITNQMLRVAGAGSSGRTWAWNTLTNTGIYKTTLNQNSDVVRWVLNLRQSQANPSGLASGNYGMAVVLAGSSTNMGTAGSGYALVRGNSSTPDPLRLVRYNNGVTNSTDIISLNDGYNTRYYAVMVEYNPTNHNWTLYTATSASDFPDVDTAIYTQAGAPVSNSTHVGTALPYVAAYWAHATATDVGLQVDNFRASVGSAGQTILNPMTFTVIDEDEDAPAHSTFNVDGAAYSTNDIAAGLVVTGYVQDVLSGVYAASNVWTLLSNNVVITNGTLTLTPDTDGSGLDAPAVLTATVPYDYLSTPQEYVLRIESTDYDVDRPDDWLRTTNEYSFYVTAYIPVPSTFTATADGPEMVVMTWNPSNAPGVVLLWATNQAIAVNTLTPGASYAVNQAVSNARVAYVGSSTNFEMTVPSGSTNYYRLFGAGGTTYSATYRAPTSSVRMLRYENTEIVDQTAYTNNATLEVQGSLATGQGWTGAWTGDVSKFNVMDTNLIWSTNGFPQPHANKFFYHDTSSFTEDHAHIVRKLTIPRGGSTKTFVAFQMNYLYEGTEKYVGLSLMSDTNAGTEELFFGKVYSEINFAGINDPDGGGQTTASSYSLNDDHFQDYVVVGEWSPAEKTARLWAYHWSEEIPEIYPSNSAYAVYSNDEISVGTITGIRLGAGSDGTDGTWSNELGHVYFDEVRVAGTWEDLFNFTMPAVYDYDAGVQVVQTNWVSDGQLSEAEPTNKYHVGFAFYHRTGIDSASFDLLDVTTNEPLYTNITLSYSNTLGNGWMVYTNTVTNRVDIDKVYLGSYTSRVYVKAGSGRETNTILLSETGGASDLFFGEFGEGNYEDKYVELYNGTGSDVDLSQYWLASQTAPAQKYVTWNLCRLSASNYWMASGTTLTILNGGKYGLVGTNNTAVRQEMVDALSGEGRAYLLSSNQVLNVGGDDPVVLFHLDNTNEWIDMCGYADEAQPNLYIMRRTADAEVPWSYPQMINTNQWDYRDWSSTNDLLSGFTDFLTTAGVYDREVGLGGYIKFLVYDDDTNPPTAGDSTVLETVAGSVTNEIFKAPGEHEVVFTAWSFTNRTSVEACAAPWARSLLTNAYITWTPTYTNQLVNTNSNTGANVNDVFDGYDQYAPGELYMRDIGSTNFNFGVTNVPWIQFELPLIAADDISFSWAEQGGTLSFTNVSVQWSLTGAEGSFQTSAAWPNYTMTDGTTWRPRVIPLTGVIPAGASKVYLRLVLGPGHGGTAGQTTGSFRMDNIQVIGRPEEYEVTDGQIAAAGYQFQVRGNVYDADSGVASNAMRMGARAGTFVAESGDGKTNTSTTTWAIGADTNFTKAEITDLVLASELGSGVALDVEAWDSDADRTESDDSLAFAGSLGRMRVVDDDSDRPRLTLAALKPRGGILAQWLPPTTNSLLPTRQDGSVGISAIMCATTSGAVTSPKFVDGPGGAPPYALRQQGWSYNSKYWHAELVPETDMAITNISFQSRLYKDTGPHYFVIRHYVDSVLQDSVTVTSRFTTGAINTNTWYSSSLSWATNAFVLQANKENQIRIHGCFDVTNRNYNLNYWAIYNLTFWQVAIDTTNITEVSDAEFASGSFKIQGSTWDEGSGIFSPTSTEATNRPAFSLYLPTGAPFVTNLALAFTNNAVTNPPVADGGVTNEAEGGFINDLPKPAYTNLVMGEYTGAVRVVDYDDDRTEDSLIMGGDIALYVVDNDNGVPTSVGTVRINGTPATNVPSRFDAAWTNTPEFLVTFDTPAVDQDPGAAFSAKQRILTGIGEYRVTTSDPGANPTNRGAAGTPYPAAVTNGALANYGFEMLNTGWTLASNSTYYALASNTNYVREGLYSLRQTDFGRAYQQIEFENTNATIPKVGVSGWYRSDSTGGAIFRIEAFTSANLTNAVATSNLVLETTNGWTQFTVDPAIEVGDGTVEALRISLIDGGGNTTYWDDIRLSVDVGNNRPAIRFVATAASQGLTTTNYLFAVDADNNRAGDRLGSVAKPFVLAYDITPPTAVNMLGFSAGALSDSVDDPTTQFDLQWTATNVGPDDPGHTNHPTHVSTERDILSPWQTYKVYYGTFNPLQIPSGDDPANTNTGFVYTNFIANNAYRSWPNIISTTRIEDPSAPLTNYPALTTLGTGTRSNRIYDLEFDQDYVIIVVGVDRAGNEGPAGASSWATNNTIKFSLIRGWTLPKDQALAAFPNAPTLSNDLATVASAFAWTAGKTNAQGGIEVTRDYDLLYMERTSFQENSNISWQILSTVRSNWFVDDGGMLRAREAPLRFYRASYKDRWRTVRQDGTNVVLQRPMASEEVYGIHNVVLSGGQNFLALQGLPHTNTFRAVFGGLETFPGGGTVNPSSGATLIEFYSPGTNAPVSDVYFLNNVGEWRSTNGVNVTSNDMGTNFFNRGFSIHLPKPLPDEYASTTAWDYSQGTNGVQVQAMVWCSIGQVPTNGLSQVIQTGRSGAGRVVTNVFNLVAFRLPVWANPKNMNLVESGFVQGEEGLGDEIYTLDTRTKDPIAAHTLYCDTNNVWRYRGSGAPAGDFSFAPNDVIVIVSRNWVGDGSWTWTYQPTNFYQLPNRWMGWSDSPILPPLADEPTTHSASLTFSNVESNQMTASWTSGNGQRRMVVVRQGTSTDWIPMDGIAPTGVNGNFLGAVDQGNGNKICYNGTNHTFTLYGLAANTYYSFRIFEYNGTGMAVNYFTGSNPAAGTRSTGN